MDPGRTRYKLYTAKLKDEEIWEDLKRDGKTKFDAGLERVQRPHSWYYYYYYYYTIWMSLSQAFLPGTSLEPAVILTAQASRFPLQYFPYYV